MPTRKSSVHVKSPFYFLLATIQIMTLQILMEKIRTTGLVPLLIRIVNFILRNKKQNWSDTASNKGIAISTGNYAASNSEYPP